MNNNSATFNVTTTSDSSTEGNELYSIQLRTGTSGTSTLLATSSQVTINDTSILLDITPSTTSLNEGAALAIGISGAPNTTYYWTASFAGLTAAAADLSATSGSATTASNGAVTISNALTATADATTEGAQTFFLQLRTGSTSGSVVANTNTITINDTSQTPAAPTELSYYELTLLRTITGQASYWATTTDSLASYAGQTGRVVFNYTNGSSSFRRYRGDMQLDSISFDGSSYSFDAPSGHDFVTSTAFSGTAASMDPNTLSTFNDQIRNYANLTTGTTSNRWNVDANGTGSSQTGLSTAHSGSYYVYAETSGSGSQNQDFTLASPLVTLSSNPGNLFYAFARYGSNIGSTRVYWAETTSTDPYGGSGTGSSTITGPVTRTSPSSSPNWVDGQYSTTQFLTAYGGWPSNANGQTCRLVIAYITGNGYQADLQLDEWYANATGTSAVSGETNLNLDTSQSSQSSTLTTYSSAEFNTTSAPTANDIQTIYNNTTTWSSLSGSASNSYWSIDSGGTGSSGTGLTSLGAGSYVYYEATQTGFPYKMRLLRSKQFTATANRGFRGRIGAYGSAMGRMRVYVAIE